MADHHGLINNIWMFFFPNKNIGIEYQGIQHQRPVDIFGGEEGFKYRQELDKKKKIMSKKWM